jgi:TrmH family RNA methyltransferase
MVLDVEIDDAIKSVRAAGLQIFGASAEGVAIPELTAAQLAAPTVWMFGNEAWGFEPGVLEQADQTVAVPIYGGAESLNLATAASICLYASAFVQNA